MVKDIFCFALTVTDSLSRLGGCGFLQTSIRYLSHVLCESSRTAQGLEIDELSFNSFLCGTFSLRRVAFSISFAIECIIPTPVTARVRFCSLKQRTRFHNVFNTVFGELRVVILRSRFFHVFFQREAYLWSFDKLFNFRRIFAMRYFVCGSHACAEPAESGPFHKAAHV